MTARRTRSDALAPTAEPARLEIRAMGTDGDGLAEGPIFVPFTLPDEVVRARLSGNRGELVEILSACPDRQQPPCRHFGACGGCALQHWRAAPYLDWKREQIRIALARERIDTEILAPFATKPGARRRLALHARRLDHGIGLGFKTRRSWRLAPIEECAIADAGIAAALSDLRRLAEPFLEHAKSAPTLHVTSTDTGLDVDVTGVERRTGGLSADARMRAAQAAGAANFARVTLAGEVIYQARKPTVRLGPASVALPPGAFLQASVEAERSMAEFALAHASGARAIADLYCGVGTFTFRLATLASVRAADANGAAIAALTSAVATAPGLRAIVAERRDLDRRPFSPEDLKDVDVALIDPPRAGAAAQTKALGRSAVARVIAVSCNPATFARDAALLVGAGFRLEKVLPVDQFLWSAHIELVGVFQR